MQEFALVSREENVHGKFEESFMLWCRAVPLYSKQTQIRFATLQEETRDYFEDLDDGKCAPYNNKCKPLILAVIKSLTLNHHSTQCQ